MRLFELFHDADLRVEVVQGSRGVPTDENVLGIALDSRQVQAGYVFAALPGRNAHGAMFVPAAVESGAIAVLTDARGLQLTGTIAVPTFVVENPRAAVAQLSAMLWGNPTDKLIMVGVTGTNGKTTVAHLVQAGLVTAGIRCGVVGTLGAALPGERGIQHPRTTPEAPDLQRTLDWMVRHEARAVAMEVSSIALREGRVDGITFEVAVFTGLTQDHLDYHGTMHSYFEAKAELFTPERARRAVVMVDDSWGRALVEGSSIPMTTVSTEDRSADWFASRSGDQVSIVGPEEVRVRLPIPTDFTMTNVTLSIAVCHLLGVPARIAAQAVAQARVPGRMEVVSSVDDIDFIVDYAHTPDAIRQVVSTAAASRKGGRGRVIVVVGAGGDRDASKREEMGQAASTHADVVFVTDDNPRSEDPASIREAVLRGTASGASQVFEVASRAEAIERAVYDAASGDVVLVLGKGHEVTQEVDGHVLAFDDRLVLASFVQNRFGGGEEGERR